MVNRDFPAAGETSRLSVALAFGELSVNWFWRELKKCQCPDKEMFMRQLIWREFSYHLLFHFPLTSDFPLGPKFLNFPWQKTKLICELGKKGKPVIPWWMPVCANYGLAATCTIACA
ncbi:MAG: hypothetical protein IT292_08355 [Deltaproteobacteria bacterium]|nr:hypothetical protein [Deltaproteobacteria bacterium]